ncbi:ATP-binding cassette domain-containing protein [Ruegeria pomeroyi]|nr:ATP-binding cassette domain-containing protein [Ruegeria pomeroyi]
MNKSTPATETKIAVTQAPGISLGGGEEARKMSPPLRLVEWFADYYARSFTPIAVMSRLPAGANLGEVDDLELALRAIGFRTRVHRAKLKRLDPIVLPCISVGPRGDMLAIIEIDAKRRTVTVFDPATGETEVRPLSIVQKRIRPDLLLVTPLEDVQSASFAAETNSETLTGRHWFWGPVFSNWQGWGQVMLATLLINIMALALPLFVMNVYDRVIPTNSTVTLWTLAIGVGIAISLDLLLRLLRAGTLEGIGRRVDLKVASALFRQVLNLRHLDRQAEYATLAGRIREYETVREFFASASFVALVDFLFVGVFVAVLFAIVGPLAYVPLAAILLTLVIASVSQLPMAKTAQTAIQVAARRLSVLSETLAAVTTVKSLNAENVLQREWENAVASSSRLNGRARIWAGFAQSATLAIQQLNSVFIVVLGVYLIVAGEITVGGLIAANILASRALAPLAVIAQTIFRAQYARKSLSMLNDIMARPTERHDTVQSNLRVRKGAVSFREVTFTYPDARRPAIDAVELDIPEGARIALLGRVGSGKSTLGMLLSGLISPEKGTILVDNHGLSQFDPAELRDGIGYLPQSVEAFTGSLRENLLIGRPNSSQSEIERALYLSGLDEFVSSVPEGLNYSVGQRGARLSGGQAQALSLARMLLRSPRLLFLDEPTNAMDQGMEARVCQRLDTELGPGTGLILCTHRQPLANIASRYVVLDAGKKVLDGTREDVSAQLSRATTLKQTGQG